MNIWGKVFAFLVVTAAICASIFTARLVQVRNSWTAKVVASKNKFDDLKPKVANLEVQIDSLKNEIFRSQKLWGTFWANVQTAVINADGTVQVGIGTKSGVGNNMLLHGFEIAADGTSIYRGAFLPIEVQDAESKLKPNFRASAAEVRTWQPGNWRWRNLVPPGYEENFDKQLTAILRLEETLNDRMRTFAGQKQLLADANAKLKLREAELIGGDELAKGDAVDPEHREGLVAAMDEAEESRNQTLLKLDELRRAVRGVQEDIERLQEENIDLTNRLPQPASKSEITQKK
jgi:predicted  nucleic acid-binding Zn-ribbon protein